MRTPTLTHRRMWGSSALAISNLIASLVLLNPAGMEASGIHTVPLRMMSVWHWGTAFLVAGLGLGTAVIRRSLGMVHIFGILSIMVWTALTIGAFTSTLTVDGVSITPLGVALFAWMFVGPICMLIVPLVYDYRLRKELDA